MNSNRGSEWRKWDLHIHTPASDGNGSPDEIVEKAIEQGLSVIAITDHHCADYIDKVKNAAEGKNISVISGIEFRSEYGSKSVHFIAYFPDYYGTTQLNSQSLHDLILSKLSISRTNLIAKGKEQDPSLSDNDAFKKGMFLVQVDFKTASSLVHQYGGIISVHNGRKENGLDSEVKHFGRGASNAHSMYEDLGTMKEELMKQYIDICDIGCSDNERDRLFYLKQFNHPSIICSDAHSVSEIGKSFTWIKADPTFEGLKQILFEPEMRVKIQIDRPDYKHSYQIIDSISLNKEGFWNNTIFFNENLNTIVGGRSTGKSTLLKTIAKKIDNNVNIKENSDFILNNLDGVEIKWKDNSESSIRDIDFFPQGHMYDIADNQEKIDKLIEEIIKNTDNYKLIENYNIRNSEITKSILQQIVNAFQLQSEIYELSDKLKQKGDKSGIESEIKILQEKIDELSKDSNISDDDSKNYQDMIKCVSDLDTKNQVIDRDIEQLNNLKTKSIFDGSYINLLSDLSFDTKASIEGSYNELTNKVNQEWLRVIENGINALSSKKVNNSTTKNRITQSEVYIKCYNYYKRNTELMAFQSKLQIECDKLKIVEEFETKILNKKTLLDNSINCIVNEHISFKTNVEELVGKLHINHDEVSIEAKQLFEKELMQSFLETRLNQRGNERQVYINTLVNNYQNDTLNQCKVFLTKAITNGVDYKNNYDNKSVISDFFTRNWFRYSFVLTYQQDEFYEMSQGKKAFVILKLLLDFSKKECPILIDQPEDSLDNRAIYNELVEYIKNKKNKRQIILVTHNPNVVVGADAENVIVANQHGTNSPNIGNVQFKYINGSLENSQNKQKEKIEEIDDILDNQGIREHICEILEGGEEAFVKREKKYGFKK